MNHSNAKFLIETERRREEITLAAQYRLVKEAQRAGMEIPPLLSLKNFKFSPLAVALAQGLAWIGFLARVLKKHEKSELIAGRDR